MHSALEYTPSISMQIKSQFSNICYYSVPKQKKLEMNQMTLRFRTMEKLVSMEEQKISTGVVVIL